MSKKQAGIHELVYILTELVRERGEADEELLSQFAAGPDRVRVSIETSNLKSYAVEFAVQKSLSDSVKTEVLKGYNAKWDEWSETKPMQGQLRQGMIAAGKTFELGCCDNDLVVTVHFLGRRPNSIRHNQLSRHIAIVPTTSLALYLPICS